MMLQIVPIGQVSVGEISQLLVGFAAIAALFLGPWMGFRNARRLVVAESRQTWLDGVRADVARIIAIHGEIVVFRAKQKNRLTILDTDPPELMREIGELCARVRMRLNVREPCHIRLNEAIARFITNYETADPNEIIKAMDPIADEVWKDIKNGRL